MTFVRGVPRRTFLSCFALDLLGVVFRGISRLCLCCCLMCGLFLSDGAWGQTPWDHPHCFLPNFFVLCSRFAPASTLSLKEPVVPLWLSAPLELQPNKPRACFRLVGMDSNGRRTLRVASGLDGSSSYQREHLSRSLGVICRCLFELSGTFLPVFVVFWFGLTLAFFQSPGSPAFFRPDHSCLAWR